MRRRVRRADGPERVFGEWWKSDVELARSRDYFQVEDEGGERYWILSRRRRRGRHHRQPALVHGRGVRMTGAPPEDLGDLRRAAVRLRTSRRCAARPHRANSSTRPSAWVTEALAICDRNGLAGMVRAHHCRRGHRPGG
ncbi:hypothetical protein ACRAWD_11375 [Caulobacter segnis]